MGDSDDDERARRDGPVQSTSLKATRIGSGSGSRSCWNHHGGIVCLVKGDTVGRTCGKGDGSGPPIGGNCKAGGNRETDARGWKSIANGGVPGGAGAGAGAGVGVGAGAGARSGARARGNGVTGGVGTACAGGSKGGKGGKLGE